MWGEDIDLLNGGLNLSIPIGPNYKVSADVSLQLKLTYSSKLWVFEDSEDFYGGNKRHRSRSRLQGHGQAGLGFMLHMGRILTRANSVECDAFDPNKSRVEEHVFEDSTGAVHTDQGPAYWRGSPDGSYTRFNGTGSVQTPDGIKRTLGHTVSDLATTDWPKCASVYPPPPGSSNAGYDVYTNDYRGNYVTQIERSGQPSNYFHIDYDPNVGMQHLIKTITPYRNGIPDHSQAITFENSREHPSLPGQPPLSMGYVKSITLPVFSSDPNTVVTATYVFNYTVDTLQDLFVNPLDPNDPDKALDNQDVDPNKSDKFEDVLLLTKIDFPSSPGQQAFSMSFGYSGPGFWGRNVGLLRSRTLPTGAGIEYDYGFYEFSPEVCSPGMMGTCPEIQGCTPSSGASVCSSQLDPAGMTIGVVAKRIKPTPGQSFEWKYDRNTHAEGRPNPAAVVVSDPLGNDTVTYFHAQSWDARPTPHPVLVNFYHNNIWNNGLSYKTEYYKGASANPGNLVRTEYQVWEDDVDNPTIPTDYRHTGNYKRIIETGTIYNDDGGRLARAEMKGWDGLGHFRETTEFGFDGLPYRIHRTDHNSITDPSSLCPGLSQAHCNNWILWNKTYSQVLDRSGTLQKRSEYAYDPLGFLRLQQDLLTLPIAIGSELISGDPNSGTAGDVKTQFYYEGDPDCPDPNTRYASGNVCKKVVSDYAAFSHTEHYTYEKGTYLQKRKIVGIDPWFPVDNDVDLSTGLVRASRDPAGVQTTFEYDKLGRLLSVVPGSVADSSGATEAIANITYPSILTTRLEQAISGNDKIFSEFSFDTLGRLTRTDRRQWDGNLKSQSRTYDILNRVTFESEWGSSVAGTEFDYRIFSDPNHPYTDPIGRVQATTTADGHVTRFSYRGTASTVTVEGIETGTDPNAPQEVDSRTTHDRDGFGRLLSVVQERIIPATGSASRSGARATYSYDVLDRLREVVLESDDPNIALQRRTFTYDSLGRETSATNPESGTVLKTKYDPLGNLLEYRDAEDNVFTRTYDAASRVNEVAVVLGSDPNNQLHILQQSTYDQVDGTFGLGRGRLTTSISYDDKGQLLVKEQSRYGGMNGRVSQISRKYGGWNPGITNIDQQAEILTGFAYNALGMMSKVDYPEKPSSGRNVLTPRMTYANGYLRSIADDPNKPSNRGTLVESIEYNSAGGVSKLRTRGSVETLVSDDVRHRPTSINITKMVPTPIVHFSSGTYEYDGANNIKRIGDDRFGYDALNRLIKGQVVDGSKLEELDWAYDVFGNMSLQRRVTTDGPSEVERTHWFKHEDPNATVPRMNQNRILSYGVDWVDLPGDTSSSVEYDGNGNVISDELYRYVLDSRNRLTEVHRKSDQSLVSRYTYDASGHRLSKYDGASQMTIYYMRESSGKTLSEFRRPNNSSALPSWLKDYVYADGRHVAMVENEVPNVPGGLGVGTSAPGGEIPFIHLSWPASGELDIWGYLVSRTGGGSSILFGTGEEWGTYDPLGNELHDTQVVEGTEYTYQVLALDLAGRQSGYSESIVATPGDTSSPASPTSGSAVAGDGQVTLNWTGPSSLDLWGYRIYRKKNSAGEGWVAVSALLRKPQSSFTDTTAENGTEYDFQVKSVDTSSRESAGVPAPNAWRRTPIDSTPPDTPGGFYAVAEDTSVLLGWVRSGAMDVERYQIFRASVPIDPLTPGTPIGDPNVVAFTDTTGISPDTRYFYRVRAVDKAGNPSSLSSEITVTTRLAPSALPAPTISGAQALQWRWDYCMSGDLASNCYLRHNMTNICWWHDDPNVPNDSGGEMHCPPWTHENSREIVLGWDAGGTGATLDSIRLYSRGSSSEQYQLDAEYKKPFFYNGRWEVDGQTTQIWDHYPLAVKQSVLPTLHYQDRGFDPAAMCEERSYKVSAVTTINSVKKESVLSAAEVELPQSLAVPENLLVSEEAIEDGECTQCPITCQGSGCENRRFNSAYYGLTLNWTPGGTTCNGSTKGYHVYRTRQGGAYPPIRMTREPVEVPIFRVEYLPIKGASPSSKSAYRALNNGLYGYYKSAGEVHGDPDEPLYSVRTVDSSNMEGAFSQVVGAHTDAQVRTWAKCEIVGCNYCDVPPCNYEKSDPGMMGSDYAIPTTANVKIPGAVTGLYWAWHFGRDPVAVTPQYHPEMDVGPVRGNWAHVKWTLPTVDATHGPANDFRLLRRRIGESAYTEVETDLMPGDDAGIRKFIWNVPLDLACEDADYAVQSFDVLGRAGGAAYFPSAIGKWKLIPEDFAVSSSGAPPAPVSASWKPLPSCDAGTNSHYVMSYTIKASTQVSSCLDPAPDPNTYVFHTSRSAGSPPYNVIFEAPIPGGAFWYTIQAEWSDGSSAPSYPVCYQAGGQGLFEDGALAEDDYRVATQHPSPPRPKTDSGESFMATEHRIVGQSGGNNPAVALYFYHVDHLGTPRVITDVSGNAVSKHKYLPFGEELSPPPSMNTHQFTGHERDKETGLDYMLARFYNPGMFRFMGPDPSVASIDAQNPQSWNRYAYANNNPLRFVDPDGLEPKKVTTDDVKQAVEKVKAEIKEGANPVEVANKALNALGDFSASGAVIAQGLKDAGIELPQEAQDALANVDSVTKEGSSLTVTNKKDGLKLDLPGPNAQIDKKVTATVKGSGKELSVSDIKGLSYGPKALGLGPVKSVEAKGGEGGKVDVTVKVGIVSKSFTTDQTKEGKP
ncbi:MAG: RHS repeat-associated core domain-containing protein [Candidatus Polarisedimenticolia bacterium]